MKHVRRAAAVTGGAVAVLALAGTGTAFAWHPSDATLTVGCRPDAGHVELVLGNNYKAAGDYTLSLVGGTEEYHGTVEAHGTTKVTVSYSGNGDQWRYTLADTHVDKTIADVPLCPSGTPTPTQTPTVPSTPTPSRTATPTPSTTPSGTPSATTPAATPSGSPTAPAVQPAPTASTSAAPTLAQTGGSGSTTLAVAGAATLAAGAGLVVAGRKVAARRKA